MEKFKMTAADVLRLNKAMHQKDRRAFMAGRDKLDQATWAAEQLIEELDGGNITLTKTNARLLREVARDLRWVLDRCPDFLYRDFVLAPAVMTEKAG